MKEMRLSETTLPPASHGLHRLDPPDGVDLGGARIDALTTFEGALYVATGAVPASGQEPGRGAGLLRIDPADGGWQPLVVPPATGMGTGGPRRRAAGAAPLPADFPNPLADLGADAAFTALAVFQGRSDAKPCLYVTTAMAGGGRVLRSEDGATFAPVHEGPADGPLGFRALTVWGDWLVMTAFAVAGTEGLAARTVLGTQDPAGGVWTALCVPGFGDDENTAISAIAVHGGRLYAGTENAKIGFQLWSATAAGPDSGDWLRHLQDGAARYAMSPAIATMTSGTDALWIGTTMAAPPRIAGLEWPAAELLVLYDDGGWDLIAGEPRFTPQGLRFPLSLCGPGFDDPAATAITAIIAGETGIVVGTGPAAWLWTSPDGEDWSEIDMGTEDGAGDAAASGGVTAACAAGDRLWLAINGRMFHLEQGA